MHKPGASIAFLAVLVLTVVDQARPQSGRTEFVPLRPCRVVDSRSAIGASGPLAPGAVHKVFFRNQCGIPGLTDDGGSEVNRATALALNIIAVSPPGFGHLTAWPTNQAMPAASVINYSGGQNIANGVVIPMCDEEIPEERACQTGDISFASAVSPVHLVVDVTGYYIKAVQRGTVRHGAGVGADNFLCVNNAQGVRFGLSSQAAHRADADRLCPAGTWVCTFDEVGNTGCDTSRPDGTCDARSCAGACIDDPIDNHRGWTDSPTNSALANFFTVNEAGVFSSTGVCEIRPAWCCSAN